MYNDQLNKLIEMALMDGELTEKEKQILFKKAETFGVDLDEFEMVLEAKLFEKKKSINKEQSATTASPKSNKLGDIRKCPACGSMLESYKVKCPDCDHEFSGIEANSSIKSLFKMLNSAEAERVDQSHVSQLMGEMFNGMGLDRIGKKKKEIISNFPIPTTKDDMLEFMSLALPKSRKIGNFFTANQPENKEHNTFVPVWKAKCEQIVMKAKFSMKEDKPALDQILSFAKEIGIK